MGSSGNVFEDNLIKGNLDSIAKEALWFIAMDIVVLVILSLAPILSLYLPVAAGLYQMPP